MAKTTLRRRVPAVVGEARFRWLYRRGVPRTSPGFLCSHDWNSVTDSRDTIQEKQGSASAQTPEMLLILLLFTVLLLSAVMWVALFLAKQVTIPIQALAEGTREISAGNFDYQVPEQAQDELGILVRSFSTMTTQLRDNRCCKSIQFTPELATGRRRNSREAPINHGDRSGRPFQPGSFHLTPAELSLRANTAVTRMFGNDARNAQSLDELHRARTHRVSADF